MFLLLGLREIFPKIRHYLYITVGEGIGDGVGDGVGDDVGDGVGEGIGDGVGDGVGDDVGDDVGDGVGDGIGLRRIAPLGFRKLQTSCHAGYPACFCGYMH